MREDYRKNDLDSLRRHFLLAQWFLTDEDKGKIRCAIEVLEQKQLSPLVRYALKVLGGSIVDKK